jgi:hypothetical protein
MVATDGSRESSRSRSPRREEAAAADAMPAVQASRGRSRSPPRDEAATAAKRAATPTAEATPAVGAEQASTAQGPRAATRASAVMRLQGHSEVDFSRWQLLVGPRNRKGELTWNLRAPVRDGELFKFHETGTAAGDQTVDPWSTVIYQVKPTTQEGTPDNKIKLVFEISDGQQATVERLERSLVDLIFAKSAEVLNLKQPLQNRELVGTQYLQTILKPKTDIYPSKAQMKFVIRGDDKRLGTMRYFKLQADGETYELKPEVVKGWDKIEPLIADHMLQGAQIRVHAVRCWALSVVNKKIYPTVEIVDLWVREPKARALCGSCSSMPDEEMAQILAL